MILDRYIYPLDKIYSEAVGVLYPVCGAQNDVPPTPPTPEPQELVDFYWGVWADDDNRPNYFSTTLSFSEREINLSELPEGWYGKAITDYGEIVVNANDIVFGNALDIPHDDSDLTNLVNYTGEDQTLATTFEIYDANDNLLYYIASTDVEIVRSPQYSIVVENAVITRGNEDVITMNIQINGVPEGWYGGFYYGDGDYYTTEVFTADNIENGVLTMILWDQGNGFLSPAHMALFDNESAAYNYMYVPDDPYVPVEGNMYEGTEIEVSFIVNGGSNYLEVTDCMFMYDEQHGWDVGMMVDTNVSDFTEGYFGYTDQNGELQTLTFTPQDFQGNILHFANLVGCPPTGDYVQMSLVDSNYEQIIDNMTITYQTL